MPNPGYLTPSTFAGLMSKGKGGEEFGKTAISIIDQLVLDLLGVERPEDKTPISCQWGFDHEWEAIQGYEERTFRSVQHPVEFTASISHPYVGGTMDGLVGKRGGVEVKSPYDSLNHLANLENATQFKTIYKHQLQGYFWIYGLDWIDCISYDPRFPEPKNLAIYRKEPDLQHIATLQKRCELAYEIALERVEKIKNGGILHCLM